MYSDKVSVILHNVSLYIYVHAFYIDLFSIPNLNETATDLHVLYKRGKPTGFQIYLSRENVMVNL